MTFPGGSHSQPNSMYNGEMNKSILLAGGMGAILVGLAYIFRIFGNTEAEVVTWGWVSVYMGISLVVLTLGFGHGTSGAARVILSLSYAGLALLQVVPILLWIAFHGAGISDGTPPSGFVAHWMYAIPHLVIVIFSLLALHRLWQPATPALGTRTNSDLP